MGLSEEEQMGGCWSQCGPMDVVLVDQQKDVCAMGLKVAEALALPPMALVGGRPRLAHDVVATIAKKLSFADHPQDSWQRATDEEGSVSAALMARIHKAPGEVPS
ncbi:hypothetical protein E2562_001886 [Oryza meyeriana var. granulata]|uniref:Uncharacterized protein n=1 Tax=Oryza meyeriana var. granulata TaxID=110450 RepID=A0A6G1C368_9ORYZ|nr:hypothetical protein E2562_001886 [Oryza meyeriana var. granulata]